MLRMIDGGCCRHYVAGMGVCGVCGHYMAGMGVCGGCGHYMAGVRICRRCALRQCQRAHCTREQGQDHCGLVHAVTTTSRNMPVLM
jgi:hypothetical protein